MVLWRITVEKLLDVLEKNKVHPMSHGIVSDDIEHLCKFSLFLFPDKESVGFYLSVEAPHIYPSITLKGKFGILDERKKMTHTHEFNNTWIRSGTSWGNPSWIFKETLLKLAKNNMFTLQFDIVDKEGKFPTEEVLSAIYDNFVGRGVTSTIRLQEENKSLLTKIKEHDELMKACFHETETIQKKHQEEMAEWKGKYTTLIDEEMKRQHKKRKVEEEEELSSKKQKNDAWPDFKKIEFDTLPITKLETMLEDIQSVSCKIKEQIKKSNICSICCEHNNNSVTSCGHMFCHSCIKNVKACPRCSKTIDNIILVSE